MKTKILILLLLVISVKNFAQGQKKDTIKLEEVIVTATKSKQQLSNITVPVTLIKEKDVKQGAALTLQSVLSEYTGLNISTTAIGAGIQLQGLDSDYTLILIDGQPIVGRLNGTLDLSRISVENIEQIEIVNGPSSVLYGSEALAGVVNIITKKSKKGFGMALDTKMSSFNTYKFSSNTSYSKNKFQAVLSTNYYTTQGYKIASSYQGYNLASQYYGKTVSPHHNQTYNSNIKYALNDKLHVALGLRYFKENQAYNFLESNLKPIQGIGKVNEWNIAPSIIYNTNKKFKTSTKFYFTNYHTNTDEYKADNSVFKSIYYLEKYTKAEIKNDYKFNTKNIVTLGLGYAQEAVSTSNLIDNSLHTANNKYIFAQYLLDITKKLNIVVGARFDKHDTYTNQFNPKISFLYRVKPTFIVKASIGRGFKKPTFKQLYFNYTNNAVGYTVLGTTYVEQGIANLLTNNQIALDPTTNKPVIYNQYYKILNSDGKINPESSVGMNLGFKITAIPNTILTINLFRNDLKNLIDTTPIALKTNGWQTYSYQNLNRVFSQGLTLDANYQLTKNIKVSFGYQYLEAKDKEVLKQLDGSGIYAQNPETLSAYRVTKKDYGGLLNRSKHTANFKVLATNIYKGITANLRVMYKGKYGFADLNNNQILDIEKEYTNAYFLANSSISKNFLKEKLKIQLGVDNLFDFTYATPEYTISSLAGRTFYATINYKF